MPANFHTIDHPLIKHKLVYIRDKGTSSKIFRELVREISAILAYEATKNLPTKSVKITTPLTKTTGHKIDMEKIVIVPVLRAGLGMTEGVLSLLPGAKVGHIGMERDHDTFLPTDYYFKIPSRPKDKSFLVLDPMLATGGTVIDTIHRLKDSGALDIRFLCLIASPEGVKALNEAHPDVIIFTGVVDEKLNSKKYIVPGLGDAGDRLFGTE
tara:strand:+ start:217910 stop:218542 length:633 start_codon:yes stop_codon:yes gene_type:complete